VVVDGGAVAVVDEVAAASAEAGVGVSAGARGGDEVGLPNGVTASGTSSFPLSPISLTILSNRCSNAASSSCSASHIWYHKRVPMIKPTTSRIITCQRHDGIVTNAQPAVETYAILEACIPSASSAGSCLALADGRSWPPNDTAKTSHRHTPPTRT